MHRILPKMIAALSAAVVLVSTVGGVVAQPAPGPGWGAQGSDLPPDPDVRYGTLPNGLRYAIQHNVTPPGQVVIRLQVQAGSMQEASDQLGYAHFLEHLAFRGSTHLADGEYAKRLSTLGAAFGADVNAFTTPQTTTFHVDLPRPDAAGLDTGLLLLREIASELTLKPETLNAERQVILAEERTNATVGRRASYAANAFLYDGHPYARPVVGTIDSIQGASVGGVRKFYNEYYRPERTILAIVGDVDPATVEAQIRTHFGDWRGSGAAGTNPAKVADKRGPQRIFLYNEPGLAPDIRLVWRDRHPTDPDTRAIEVDRITETLALGVLANRLTDYAQTPNASFRRAGLGYQLIPGVTSEVYVDVNNLSNWKAALNDLYGPLRSVTEAPVDQTEVDRVIQQRRLGVREAEARAATRSSGEIMQSLLNDISSGRVHISPATRRALFDQAVAGLTKARVEAILKGDLTTEDPLVVVTSPAAIPGGEDSVRAQIALAKIAPLTAHVVEEAKAWPFQSFGPPGKVAERRDAPVAGVTYIRFENGVRLTVKPTQFRADEILVNVRFGDGQMGWSRTRIEPERALWLPMLSEGGLEGISTRDRNLYLTGKLVNLSVGVSDDSVNLSGTTRGEDLDVELQLMTADLTAAAWRPENFEAVKRQQVGLLLGRGPPTATFRNRESALWRSGDLRWAVPSAVQVAGASFEQTRAFGKAMMAKGPIEVVVVGDVTVERAVAAVAGTLGALPSRQDGALDASAREVKFPEGTPAPVTLFHTGRPDQGLVITAWPTTDFYQGEKGTAAVDVLRELMRTRLLSQLRVAMGDTYSPQVTSAASTTSPGYGVLAARVEVPPGKMGEAFKAIDEIAADLVKAPVSAEEFTRAVNPYIETVSRQTQTNTFWVSWLAGAQADPRRLAAASQAVARARAVNVQDVHKAAQTWLVPTKAWRGQIIPDPSMPPPPPVTAPRADRAATPTP